MCSGDRPVGSRLCQTAEQFRQARVVRITRGVFAIGLDPFRLLDPQSGMNLLLEFGIGVDLVRHGLVKDSSAPRDGFHERLGGVIDEPWRR
jgi:hypothetical protein